MQSTFTTLLRNILKTAAYFVFGYIPLLVSLIGLTALGMFLAFPCEPGTIDYHVMVDAVMYRAPYIGLFLSPFIFVGFLGVVSYSNNKNRKQKRKRM